MRKLYKESGGGGGGLEAELQVPCKGQNFQVSLCLCLRADSHMEIGKARDEVEFSETRGNTDFRDTMFLPEAMAECPICNWSRYSQPALE